MKRKIIMLLSIVFILILIIIITINFPIIQGKLYTGDHIKISLTINYNNQKLNLNNLNVTCTYQEKEDCKVTSNNGNYSIKGGEYGKYVFTIMIPKEHLVNYTDDLIIHLNYINTNNWYILNSDCTINLNHDNNILSGDFIVHTKYNDGTVQNDQKEIELTDGIINIDWGI